MGNIKEADRKIDLVSGAISDLDEKMEELKENIRQRQQEINDMKRIVQEKANKGQTLQQEVDRVGYGNRQMEEQLKRKQAELKNLVGQKSDKERQGWLAEENLRKAKNDLFNAERESEDTKRDENKRQEELTYNN